MPKIIKTEVEAYEFRELPKDIQEKVIEDNRYINVEHLEWYDYILDDLRNELREKYGIEVSGNIYFDAGRDWYIFMEKAFIEDANKFIKGLSKEFGVPVKEVREAYYKDTEDEYLEIVTKYFRGNAGSNYFNLDTPELENLGINLDKWLKEFLYEYLKRIEKEYNYLISDEAVAETIEINEWLFLKDGTLLPHWAEGK